LPLDHPPATDKSFFDGQQLLCEQDLQLYASATDDERHHGHFVSPKGVLEKDKPQPAEASRDPRPRPRRLALEEDTEFRAVITVR
jgi:hypothetical protein